MMSRPTRRVLVFSIVVSFAAACGGGTTTTPPEAASIEDDTTLGAGDVFAVRVYGEEDLSNEYRVAQDGTIDFPLIGRIGVEGLQPTEIADLLEQRLVEGDFLRRPEVSILVKEYNSKKVSVIGAVAHPGTFPLTAGMTVVHAITAAGGFTALASQNGTVVTRRVNGETRRFRVPVEDVTRGDAADVPVRPGDIIYVPERLF